MPVFVDIHEVGAATAEQLAEAHSKDVAIQSRYGVNYVKYWLNEGGGKIYCLCTAPNAEAAKRVHLEAHGMVAERIVEVDPDLAEGMLGGGSIAPSGVALGPQSEPDPGIRTIVFTDIVGSTALTQRLGDRAAMAVVDRHDSLVREALLNLRGREVKHLGDGIMVAFVCAEDAILFATRIHAALRDAAEESSEPISVRVGAAAGEPVERNGDFFGSTVQLAARLCARAEPGQTLVSTAVTELCRKHRFEDVGEVMLKGFPQPLRAHAVVERS